MVTPNHAQFILVYPYINIAWIHLRSHSLTQVLKNTLSSGGSATFPMEASIPTGPSASPDSAKGFRLAGYMLTHYCGSLMWPLMGKYEEYKAGGSRDGDLKKDLLKRNDELMSCIKTWNGAWWGGYPLDPAATPTPNGAMLPSKAHTRAVTAARQVMKARTLFGLEEGSLLQVPQGHRWGWKSIH